MADLLERVAEQFEDVGRAGAPDQLDRRAVELARVVLGELRDEREAAEHGPRVTS